jgi:TPR repeat protein
VKYIATREGAERIDDSKKPLPATWRQKELIENILKDFPDTAERFEYEDYLKTPTRENASAFIAAALEQNMPFVGKRENYVDYIARRPRAERSGAHGLFGSTDEPIVLDRLAKEAAVHPGNLWTPIISLRREDAARLGYDNAANWRALLSSHAADMARGLKISPHRFRWYAAYHDEGHHPHVHMLCWSDDPREGFLTKEGIRAIKAGLAARLFRQELLHVYERQTEYRNLLNTETQKETETLISRLESGVLRSDAIENLMARLAEKLSNRKGKKQYGYLSAAAKELVDRIVDELAKDGRVADAYAKWCELRMEVLRTYVKEPEHPGPLSKQKELKRIRNIVVEEAAKIAGREFVFEPLAGEDAVFPKDDPSDTDEREMGDSGDILPDEFESEPPDSDAPAPEDVTPHATWSDEYRRAKTYLFGAEETPRDFDEAFRLFAAEARAGNALAMHDLARMHADGLGRAPDPDAARDWCEKALAAFNAAENEKADRYVEYRIGKMHAAGLGTAQDYGEAADWFRESADRGHKYAQYSLAGLYAQGKGVDRDGAAAFDLYVKAAARGFPYADFELGKMYENGVGTQRDPAASVSHFQKAYRGFVSLERQSHDDELQYRLGRMLEKGVGAEKDISAAIKFYEKAAGVGNPHAGYALARLILADGDAAPERAAEAVTLLEKAAEAGNGAAVYALAKLYRDGTAVDKNIAKAVGLFGKAALDHESDHAAYALGKLYLRGEDVPRDVSEAVRWLEQSANQGNGYAGYALAMVCLSDGEIPKDIARALPLLLQSANGGNEHALYRLGRLYLAGEDVPKDVGLALRCLTEAAERGNEYAQYALGKLYLMGGDVPRDREKARHFLEQSAAQGNEYAEFLLDRWDDFRDPSLFTAATRLLRHMGRVFRDNPPAHGKGSGSDGKQRRREREKKIALGHARDEREINMNR